MPERKTIFPREICAYVTVKGRKVHYRRMGTGPAMLMLHASPLSSTSLRPAMEVFAQHFCCIALDTPGFGLSESLSERRDDIFAYAEALKDTIEALRLKKPIVYGASTGAAITHALGCKYPEVAELLMLDTFSHHEADDMVEGYFLDMEPQSSGAHLMSVWEKAQGLFLFSPWQRAEMSRRQVRTLPPANFVHEMAMQLLTAGKGYHHVYKAAIAWENKENVNRLTTPATINLWQGGSNIERVQMLLDQGLPKNYTLIESGIGPKSRYLDQHAYLLRNKFHERMAARLDDVEQESPDSVGYIDTEAGLVHYIAAGPDQAAPLLLLHDWGASTLQHSVLIKTLGSRRRIIAPDLPGHGNSPASAEKFDDLVNCLAQFMRAQDLHEVDIIGIGNAACVAERLRDMLPDRISSISYLASSPILDVGDSTVARTRFTELMRPHVSGVQLLAAHGLAKQKRLFWNWTKAEESQAIARPEALDPRALHIGAFDTLRMRADEVKLLTEQKGGTAKDMCVFVPNWEIAGEPLPAKLNEIYSNVTQICGEEEGWGDQILAALEDRDKLSRERTVV